MGYVNPLEGILNFAELWLCEDCPFDEEERQLLERRRELKVCFLSSPNLVSPVSPKKGSVVDATRTHVDTVDGRNPASQLRLVVSPVMYKVLYIPGGAGFLPSTVLYV